LLFYLYPNSSITRNVTIHCQMSFLSNATASIWFGLKVFLPITTHIPICSQQKVFRNYDPGLRTQEKAVEYTRALNVLQSWKRHASSPFFALFLFSFSFHCEEKLRISSLLLQIFAKPFVGAMDGHIDAVSCMAKNPNYLKAIFSGSMDGGNYLLLC
jgi:hypothetical protein